MLNRRTFFVVTATSLLPLVRPTLAQSADGRASAFVKNVGDELVAVLNGPEGEKSRGQEVRRWRPPRQLAENKGLTIAD